MTLFSGASWRFDLRIGLLFLMLAQSAISVLFAVDPSFAWIFWIEFAKIIVITYLIVVHVTDARRFRLIILVIAMSLAFEGAKQGWAQLVLNPGAQNINEFALFGDNNAVGVGMLMLIPLLTTLAATAGTWWERRLHQFLAFGITYRAISTYSRGAFMASAALALYYILRSQRRVAALAGIAIAAMLIVPVLPDVFWERMSTIKTAADVVSGAPDEADDPNAEPESLDGSSAARLHFWSVALDMARDRPFTGVGHNSYNVAYDRYDSTNGHFGRRRSVHSAWLGILAELGFPGFVLFASLIALTFSACQRARRAAKATAQSADLAKFAFALEAGVIAFMVGGSFVPFQYNEMLWHTFGLGIALNALAVRAMADSKVTEYAVDAPSVGIGVPTATPTA